MEFQKQYKHPNWQRKRQDVMTRDDYQCQLCDSKDKNLHVHHKYYKRAVLIWDYPDHCYMTVCFSCHEHLHKVKDILSVAMSKIDPVYLECFAKSDLKKVSELLYDGEMDAVAEYVKTLKYDG